MIRDDAYDTPAESDVVETLRFKGRDRWEPTLSAEEEYELAARIQAGDQAARKRLILSNLRIVVDIARRYRGFHVPMDDLIQDGNLGLIRASADFDPVAHGCRFSSYAGVWIRSFIRRALVANASIIRIPEREYWRHRAHRAATATNSGDSPAEDVAREAESMPPRRLTPSKTDDTIDSTSFLEAIADPRQPEKDVAEREHRLSLERALRRLSPVEAWILRERYGLGLRIPGQEGWSSPQRQEPRSNDDDGPQDPATPARDHLPRTYLELHRDCGLSFYRIRQIEATALNKLRKAMTA